MTLVYKTGQTGDLSNRTLKLDLAKIHHQNRSNLNTPGLTVRFVFVENNNNYQVGNAFPRFHKLIKNNGAV